MNANELLEIITPSFDPLPYLVKAFGIVQPGLRAVAFSHLFLDRKSNSSALPSMLVTILPDFLSSNRHVAAAARALLRVLCDLVDVHLLPALR